MELKSDRIKYLGKGAYGCALVAEPEKNKDGTTDDKHIIKIQEKRIETMNETKIGKKIIEGIENYNDYFAPIVKTEDVNIKKIDTAEIEKCEFLQDDSTTTYESSEIEYVGEYTLLQYYLKLILGNEKRFVEMFLANYIVLLEAIEKLITISIIHYDVKENNIMIRTGDERPIIIDFGISIDASTEDMRTRFYIYSTKYAPWCIDVVFLSYIVQKISDQTAIITDADIKNILDDYFANNLTVIKLITAEEATRWKNELTAYFNTFINSTWAKLYDELIKYRFTWDTYALNILHLFLFIDLNLNAYNETSPILQTYKDLIKLSILTIPPNRTSPNALKTKLTETFKTTTRTKLRGLKRALATDFKNRDKTKEIERNVALSVVAEKTREEDVYK